MFKEMFDRVWAFDAEWVPDQLAGRLLYDVDDEAATEREIIERMWKEGGATEEDPMPFLKMVACRVVSIAVLERWKSPDGVKLRLLSLPRDVNDPVESSERHIVSTFLDAVGFHKPQLVGFNSYDSDLKVLIQRALVNNVRAAGFNERPNKPWDGKDYYARGTDCHIDIKYVVSGWGKGTPSLHELATLCGVPGKFDMDGHAVAESWLNGDHQKIVDYNECDAVTTYLVWLRLAFFGGKFTEDEYAEEIRRVHELLERETAGGAKPHLTRYAEEWRRLTEIIEHFDEAPVNVGSAGPANV